jgi:hypothetical protein
MAKNYFQFAQIFSDETIKDNILYRGISYPSRVIPFDKSNLLSTVVETNEIFRSDKVSFRIYGTSQLFWLLDHVNNFKHGFREYAHGAEILYIHPNDLPQNLQ